MQQAGKNLQITSGKKERCNEEWLREMEEDNTMNRFWEGILRKKKRIEVSNKIEKRQRKKFFRDQYTIKTGSEGGEKVKSKEQERKEKRFEHHREGEKIREELNAIIKKMKKKKATGEDEIQNEAWIYGGNVLMETMASCEDGNRKYIRKMRNQCQGITGESP